MSAGPGISIGQYSEKGRKEVNQDFHGALIPDPPVLTVKGIALALADGISSSSVSRIAAESAVKSFLSDYYCTPDTWSVKTSAQRVIAATNSWLFGQTRLGHGAIERDRGYVCTLSVLVLKSRTAHIFHVGDTRICRIAGASVERLTEDHRIAISSAESFLGRALGTGAHVEIDYASVPVSAGDIFVLTTDGVHEFVTGKTISDIIARHGDDLDQAAKAIAEAALAANSDDNTTIQIARVERLPEAEPDDYFGAVAGREAPPLPEPGAKIDGYRIVRQIHAGSRSHVYAAEDIESGQAVALKVPSIDLRGDAAYLRRFMMEEWVGRRVDSPHVLKMIVPQRQPTSLYLVSELVQGQTLSQWMLDNPKPDLESVRRIVEQIAAGLRAFHRREMIHQDLRPANVMIDRLGTAKIIDFGSTRVNGLKETEALAGEADILGTVQYTAPEYFVGEVPLPRADLFSLGVIAYHMLTGRLPYGAGVARARTRAQQIRLRYRPARETRPDLPPWVDAALRRAVQIDPNGRYQDLSEFIYDLRHPNQSLASRAYVPLLARDPVRFWQVVSLILGVLALYFGFHAMI